MKEVKRGKVMVGSQVRGASGARRKSKIRVKPRELHNHTFLGGYSDPRSSPTMRAMVLARPVPSHADASTAPFETLNVRVAAVGRKRRRRMFRRKWLGIDVDASAARS